MALSSEKKAFAFYDQALRYVNQPDVKALFEELRDEEAEHVRMIEEIIAKLPPSAAIDLEDEDNYPNKPSAIRTAWIPDTNHRVAWSRRLRGRTGFGSNPRICTQARSGPPGRRHHDRGDRGGAASGSDARTAPHSLMFR